MTKILSSIYDSGTTIIAAQLWVKGELEDICGQLGDIEGEYQKTAEEVIQRIQVILELQRRKKY